MDLLTLILHLLAIFIGAIIGNFLIFLWKNLKDIFPKLGIIMNGIVMIIEALFSLFIGGLLGASPFYLLTLWQKYKI